MFQFFDSNYFKFFMKINQNFKDKSTCLLLNIKYFKRMQFFVLSVESLN